MTRTPKKWHYLRYWKTVDGRKKGFPMCKTEGDLLLTRTHSQVDCYWCKQELRQPHSVIRTVKSPINQPTYREPVKPIHRPMMQPGLFDDKENSS